jgi:lipopolysaccharide/colanic/teichoic acid biosynthesis glycosyltransferase
VKPHFYETSGKRLLDVACASGLLLLVSPVMAATAAAIWLEDRHTPFFRQTRVGRDERPFEVLKFRSMHIATAEVSSSSASTAWVTRVGKFIRRTNIDELPQLWCVLRGDMSLVGPRPALPTQDELVRLRRTKGAHVVRPGMTGLAQLRAYDNMPDEEKAGHDGEYAAHVSASGDLRILVGTLAYLTRKPPTY